jgi:hypothetical protein
MSQKPFKIKFEEYTSGNQQSKHVSRLKQHNYTAKYEQPSRKNNKKQIGS